MGEYRWLSNFHEAPLVYNGQLYKNSESAYQDAKLTGKRPSGIDISNGALEDLRVKYLETSGKEAKAFSKTVKHLTRPDWKEISLVVMSEVVHAKFTQNKDIRLQLVNTFPHDLVEGNTWHDYFYGVCGGQGTNWLGRILMAERMYWLDMMTNKSWEATWQAKAA
jgi:ribA/ribD-fused uncharacterized protein